MKRYAVFGLIILALGLINAASIRGDQRQRGQRRIDIEQFDRNGDGKISRHEFPGRPQFFDRLDSDGDGFITQAEIDRMRQQRGRRPALGENLLRALDADGDGKVTREEFAGIVDFFGQLDKDEDKSLSSDELTGLASVRRDEGGVNVEAIFVQYDADLDGKLSKSELNAAPQFKNPRFFTMLDGDQDGFVTKEELKLFVDTYKPERRQ